MSGNYKVKVNKTLDFELTDKMISELDVVNFNQTNYHILKDNIPFKGTLVKSDFNAKAYVVNVNGNDYNIVIENELDQLINKMGFVLGKAKKINFIKAPMPGLVLEVSIKVGDVVKEDDSLLILEAMKMENNITSPRDGVIKSINVAKGDAIDKGVMLVEFES